MEEQVQQLQAQGQQQQEEIQQKQEEIEQLEAQSQMDGDAVRKSEAALRKEVAALKAAPQPAGTELATLADTGDASPDQIVAPKTKEDAMKQLAADESLSEEARESAKKALEVLVSSERISHR